MSKKWRVRQFYATHSEKIVEADTENEARQIADCIGWKEDQVLSSCEWVGGEVEEVDHDDDLTEITDDDRRTLAHYHEHQCELARGGA